MDNPQGLPLFDWKPSAKVEPFPFHRCKSRVRHVAELVSYHNGDWNRSGAIILENGMRDHLTRAGLTSKAIEREIKAFRQAVDDDCNRLIFQAVACSSEGGDAA